MSDPPTHLCNRKKSEKKNKIFIILKWFLGNFEKFWKKLFFHPKKCQNTLKNYGWNMVVWPKLCVNQCSNEYSNIFKYSNIFLRILIFVFDSWQFLKPNIIPIFEYFCTNISEYWSLNITWNAGIKGVLFSILTWRYILTTLLITMINSCWSTNP